jgi:PPOX class probable F420-dependent enzyme
MTSLPDSHRDLLDLPVGMFATIDAKGYPQLTPMGFLLDDDGAVKVSFPSGRYKAKNLRERPQCSLLVIDPTNTYRYLEIRADASLLPDDEYAFADKISAAKYGGVDFRKVDGPGAKRVVAALEPVKVHAVQLR